ncbi:uncharacterized protein LOC130448273 [Diorhabda sublineata]|uniref:uncharacterized protein LOC130448273 n=1 Tax=Diorhabda sublineata TaxID=1163346 RepID=UPI0024E09350|nr:uncharacterized protein LOC130448273 [Diorhabda sublineata]
MNINIDLTNRELLGPHLRLPFKYRKVNDIEFSFSIDPGEKTIKKLPVNIDNGDIIVDARKIENIIIPQILSTARNGFAPIEIQNHTNNSITITLREPIQVTPFKNSQYELFKFESFANDFDENNFIKPNDNITELIRTNHMNKEEKQKIISLCKEYSDLFLKPGDKLTFTSNVKHIIRTKDEVPVHTKSYRYPYVHREEIRRQIQEMLDKNIIRPSCSPWSSPIWIVKKKMDASNTQKWRLVVDYRKINEKTIDDRYPLPNISDILDKLGRAQYFTTLDLASGFHQIQMSECSIEKTAFNVDGGHYEYLRMPFGLKNAPSTFQRAVNEVLKDIQNKICMVYMDDIIIFSTSLQEHIQNLKLVFSKLRHAELKIQLDKCEFLRKEVEYLGHVVTPHGIKPNPNKIKAIQNFPIPKTAYDVDEHANPDALPDSSHLSQLIKQIDSLVTHFNYIKNSITTVTTTNSISYHALAQNMLIRTEYLINTVQKKFENLNPHIRNRRGLLNGVGKINKWLFGNLDSDDEIKYDNAITLLQQNQKNIIHETNLQISLYKKLIDHYNKSITTLNKNQANFNNGLQLFSASVYNKIETLESYLTFQGMLYQINLDCQSTITFIDNIENAVVFSKLNSVHTSIISSYEILDIIQHLEKLYSEKQIPKFSNILTYYQFLGTQVSIIDSKLVFAIHVPILISETFEFYHLFPIIQNNKMYTPKFPYLARTQNETQSEKEECPPLEGTYYCRQNFVQRDNCTLSLLEGNTLDDCQILEVNIEETIIQQVTTKEVLIMPIQQEKILSKCQSDRYLEIEEPSLVKIPENCELWINNQRYINDDEISYG